MAHSFALLSAVCGVPYANPKHAIVMAKFATDCMKKMRELVFDLESVLGPDTSNLMLRVGLHSGPGRFSIRGSAV
jgi:hypothetical protein